MSQLPKLTGTNWYEWQKEIETYFMLIGCGGHVTSTKPGGDKGLKWDQVDQKVYAVIWFFVDPNYHGPIITTKSGKRGLGQTYFRVPKGQCDELAYAVPEVLFHDP